MMSSMGGQHSKRTLIPVLANDDGSLSILTDDTKVASAAVEAAAQGGLRVHVRRSAPRHAHLGRVEICISDLRDAS